ncbi:MAG: DUF3791 domain-containing protein [Tannerella sp.]|jgi:hypothetical protein|nr:DUF3791 domain-containing protein [Tannerella sp.]
MSGKKLSDEMLFFVYLLEKYAEYKNMGSAEVLYAFDQTRLTDYIKQMYPMYHTERIENAFADIDRKMNNYETK